LHDTAMRSLQIEAIRHLEARTIQSASLVSVLCMFFRKVNKTQSDRLEAPVR